jgi:hypothetical protein
LIGSPAAKKSSSLSHTNTHSLSLYLSDKYTHTHTLFLSP